MTVTMAKLFEEQGHLDKALDVYRKLAQNDASLEAEVSRIERKIVNQGKIARLNKFLENVKQQRPE